MCARSVEDIVKTIDEIPTLPVISNKIHALITSENVTVRQLEAFIERDPPLAAKILKIVNSPFYGMLSKVSTIDHAIVVLGMTELKNIILGFSVQNFFRDDILLIDRSMFWKHAIICSQITKFLSTYFDIAKDNSFLLSGLIHDIGKLVIDRYFHEDFIAVIEYVSRHNCTFSDAEKEVLGVTHYQIAAKLLAKWQLPEQVVTQIFYHHAPWHDDNHTTGSVILYLANQLTKLAGYPCFADEKCVEPSDILNPTMLSFLNKNGFEIDEDGLERLIQRILQHISNELGSLLAIFD